MDKDKDRQLAELNRRVEQLELEQRVDRLERREGFWVATMSNTLGGVVTLALSAAAAWLWRNPDVLVSEATDRVLAVAAGVGAFVGGVLFVGSLIVMRRSAEWRLLDHRVRSGLTIVAVMEVISWVLLVLLAVLLR